MRKTIVIIIVLFITFLCKGCSKDSDKFIVNYYDQHGTLLKSNNFDSYEEFNLIENENFPELQIPNGYSFAGWKKEYFYKEDNKGNVIIKSIKYIAHFVGSQDSLWKQLEGRYWAQTLNNFEQQTYLEIDGKTKTIYLDDNDQIIENQFENFDAIILSPGEETFFPSSGNIQNIGDNNCIILYRAETGFNETVDLIWTHKIIIHKNGNLEFDDIIFSKNRFTNSFLDNLIYPFEEKVVGFDNNEYYGIGVYDEGWYGSVVYIYDYEINYTYDENNKKVILKLTLYCVAEYLIETDSAKFIVTLRAYDQKFGNEIESQSITRNVNQGEEFTCNLTFYIEPKDLLKTIHIEIN